MKKIHGLIAFLVLLAVSGVPASAQESGGEPLILTLDACIDLALTQNPLFMATRSKEAGASAQVREAASRFFPTISGQGTDILDKKVFTLEFPSMVPGQPAQRVKLDFTKSYQFTLNLSMPLFTGGKLVSGFRQANYNLMATKETIRQSRHETVFNVKQAFYGYLLAKKFSEVAGEAVALAEKHYQNVKELYDAGIASKFDLLRSEVQLANLKPQLIQARNGMAVAGLGLKMLLGLDLATPVEIKGDLEFKPMETDVEEAVSRAVLRRPELSQLEYQRRMAGEMLKIAKAGNMPTLAIGGAYNYWSNFLNFKKNNWEGYYSVNLILDIPLFNGFATQAQVGQARAQLKELEWTRKALVETVKYEVRQAVLGYKQAEESLLSQEKNVEQAREAVRIAELNYAEGLVTSLDVSTVQVALSQAETNHSQALYDCVISMAQLEKAIGDSLNDQEPK